MKPWLLLFVLLLAAGLASGLGRDLFSTERSTLKGVVQSFEAGTALPKWLPATPPRYKVLLLDGQIVNVATTSGAPVPIGSEIDITEWVTPWGQVWYTQRH
jgi:hypothetical protein